MGLLNLKRASKEAIQRTAGAPIAIDFGSASLKVLQLTSDEPPALVAAGCVETPEALRGNIKQRLEFQIDALPKLVGSLPVRGKRAVCAIPAPLTFCKHAQFSRQEALTPDILADTMLSEQLGRDASTLVRRLIEVTGADRAAGSGKGEFICLATGREIVDKLMRAIRAARLEPVGMHSEFEAVLHAFGYINRRVSDKQRATLYLDLGGGQTDVLIAHESELVFARVIGVGGLSLDECLAEELGCSVEHARLARLAMHDLVPRASPTPAPAPAAHAPEDDSAVLVAEDRRIGAPAPGLSPEIGRTAPACAAPAGASLREPLEILTDEAGMCIRYHDSMFPQRRVADVVFVGGEARHRGLCQYIARTLRLPAKVADPFARITRAGSESPIGLDINNPQPGWAVPIGLCQCPTDL
jgi:Tfp pilus assembly PilM family ATPase